MPGCTLGYLHNLNIHLLDTHFDDAHPHLVNSIADIGAAGRVDRIGDSFPDSVTFHPCPIGGLSGTSGINDDFHLWHR